MLEQFRILRAAVRLGEFTIASLSAASGVAEGTIQKTLRRRDDLFEKVGAKVPGVAGRSVHQFRVRQSAMAEALQTVADEPELVESPAGLDGRPLELDLAQDMLTRVLPGVDPADRRNVLRAAAEALEGVPEAYLAEAAPLLELNRRLVTLVDLREWLASLRLSGSAVTDQESPLAAAVKLSDSIEEILSDERRAQRDADPARAIAALDDIFELPKRAARLAANLPAGAPPPPLGNWCTQLILTAWGVFGDALWRPVSGDLSQTRKHAAAAAPHPVAAPEPPPDSVVLGKISEEPRLKRDDRGYFFLPEDPSPMVGFRAGATDRAFARGLTGSDESLDDLLDRLRTQLTKTKSLTLHRAKDADLVEVKQFEFYWTRKEPDPSAPLAPRGRVDPTSLTTSLRVSLGGEDDLTVVDLAGETARVSAIDIDLAKQAVVGLSVATPKGERWIPFAELHPRDHRLGLRMPFSDAGIAVPKLNRDAWIRQGACQAHTTFTLRLKVSPPFPMLGTRDADAGMFRGEEEAQMAELDAFEIAIPLRRLTTAFGVQSATETPISFPLADLEFDLRRGCFIQHGRNRGGSRPPTDASGVSIWHVIATKDRSDDKRRRLD